MLGGWGWEGQRRVGEGKESTKGKVELEAILVSVFIQ